MASDGLTTRAKNGKCRICHRTRSTEKYVKAVGEVRHGYATGHIWECIDEEECKKTALERIKQGHICSELIKIGLKHGRFDSYKYYS